MYMARGSIIHNSGKLIMLIYLIFVLSDYIDTFDVLFCSPSATYTVLIVEIVNNDRF